MAAFRFNHENLLGAGVTLSLEGFTEDVSRPLDRLWDRRSSRRCPLLSAKIGSLTVDFGDAVEVDHVAIINHNLTPSTTLRIQANTTNSFVETTPLDQMFDVSAPDALAELGEIATYQYWRLTINDATRSSPDILLGQLILGVMIQFLRNPDWSFKEEEQHETIQHETDGGAQWNYTKFRRHVFSLPWSTMRENRLQDLRDLVGRVGGGRTPFLMVLDDRPYYVRTQGNLRISRPFSHKIPMQGQSFKVPVSFDVQEIQFVEEPRGLRVTS